jgi:hypothetical protein
MKTNPMVAALLADLRQHPNFPDLLKAVEVPRLPRFRISQAAEVEKARAEWIYKSGQRNQHDAWLAFLTGEAQQETTSD